LEEYKKEFDFLSENTGTALAVLNSDGTIHSTNKKFEELCGYSKSEIVEKNLFIDFISGKCHSKIKKFLEASSINSLENYGAETFECKFFNRQGYQIIIVLTLNWIPKYKKFITTLTDVSNIRRTQLGRINSEQRETIVKFGSGVAHEVKNPLHAIITSVDVLRDGLELSEQDQELMNIICEEIMNLKDIIAKFSEFTRIECPTFEYSQINSLITDTLQSFEKSFFIGINKEIKFYENLPKAYIDYKQMSNVLKHILTNAVEAMPRGGNIHIYSSIITNEFHEKSIQIKIQDTGTGIYEADFERMFIPFFSTKTNHIGLGLAYCERIIYYHNGEIKVETKLDQGTKVCINLPLTFPL